MKNKKALATKIIGPIVALIAIVMILTIYTIIALALDSLSSISYGVESKYDEINIKNYFFTIDFESKTQNENSFQNLVFQRYSNNLEEYNPTEQEQLNMEYQKQLYYKLDTTHSDANMPTINFGFGDN